MIDFSGLRRDHDFHPAVLGAAGGGAQVNAVHVRIEALVCCLEYGQVPYFCLQRSVCMRVSVIGPEI
ncbi:MAG: hypothetical protein ACK40R_03160, partial [Thermomonas sp.]